MIGGLRYTLCTEVNKYIDTQSDYIFLMCLQKGMGS
jgi:hypothetical protein